ncbi:MAG: glycosyltransferase family 9 protein [Bdellovibrionia bacterium]
MVSSRFILRLSSLGDVILASSALEALASSRTLKAEKFDWATMKGYSELLKGHPKINQIFEFDRATGLRGWIEFCRNAWNRHYTEILDLHGSLRTRVMRMLFFYWGCRQPQFKPRWKTVSKQRFRLYGYFIFKNFWSKALRPSPWVERYTQLAGGTGKERPNLEHLLRQAKLPSDLLTAFRQQTAPMICVMPGSKWDGKKWPIENYVELLKNAGYFPVILGHQTDVESKNLCDLLKAAKIPHFSGVGKWNLAQTACIFTISNGYLGSDTGLAHLAEAVGVPAQVISGPTTPDMGFAPWRRESVSIGKSIGCRPCGKDGRFCFRIANRYACLKDLSAQTVLAKLISSESLNGQNEL